MLGDRIRQSTTTTGTGPFSLTSATGSYQNFRDEFTNGATLYYFAFDGTNWEGGIGTLTYGSPDTLTRTTVLSSSNADAAVNFSAGTKTVICTFPARKLPYYNASDALVLLGGVLSLGNGSAATPALNFTNSTTMGFYRIGADILGISTASTLRATFTAAGQLMIGATSTAIVQPGGFTPSLQIMGTGTSTGSVSVGRYSADNSGSRVFLSKSRGATVGSNTVVAADDIIGGVVFSAADGSSLISAADILCEVDGTPGTNDMPGRLSFRTTLDGASSPTARLTVLNSGVIIVGSTRVAAALPSSITPNIQVIGTTASNAALGVVYGANDATGPSINLHKTRNATPTSNATVVAVNDVLASINVSGADGTNAVQAGNIRFEVDATPGTNDMPTRFILALSPDASATPVTVLRVDNAGNLALGASAVSSNTYRMDIQSNAAAARLINITNSDTGGSSTAGYRFAHGGGPIGQVNVSSTVMQLGTYSAHPFNFISNSSAVAEVLSGGWWGLGATGVASTSIRLVTRGSGTTSSTFSLRAQNSSGTEVFSARDDGGILMPPSYNLTTATAANMVIDISGLIQRSTSSARFKTAIEDLNYDQAAKLLKMRPVWYRSLCPGDNPNWSYYGLLAEEVEKIDPRFVHYGRRLIEEEFTYLDALGKENKGTRTIPDMNGPLVPDGVQYERLVVGLLKLVQDLEHRVQALEV